MKALFYDRFYAYSGQLCGNRSFYTKIISYPGHFVSIWSFRTDVLVISYTVTTISYPGHFVPALVMSYLVLLGTK